MAAIAGVVGSAGVVASTGIVDVAGIADSAVSIGVRVRLTI